MPDEIQSLRIICKGGLNTNENFLELSNTLPGSATRLVNFETSLHGGYRRINGYRPYDVSFDTVNSAGGTGGIYGIFAFRNDTASADEIMASRKLSASSTYEIYQYQGGIGWTPYTTGVTLSSIGVVKQRFSLFNAGAGNNVVMVDGINNALVYDGTNWYSLSSANTGGSGSPGGDQCLNDPKYTTVFKNYVFIASGDKIAYSAPADPLTWTVAAGAGQITPGFKVVQIKPFRDELFVFGLNSIKKIVPDATSSFVLQDVTNNLGCIASDSVLEVAGSLVFLSPDGIRPIAGTMKNNDVELDLLSEDIQYLVQQYVEGNNLEYLNGVVVSSKTQFRYLFSSSGGVQSASKGIIGCYSVNREDKGWEFGELLGIRASSTWSGYLSGVEHVLHGDFNGKVYQQEKTNLMDGANIFSIYNTPYLDMGETEVRKLMRTLNLFIRSEGDVTINLGVRYDWNRDTVINPANYQSASEGVYSVYDDPSIDWDGAGVVYGSPNQPIFETQIQGSGRSVQFIFVSDGNFAPFTMQGFVIEFSPKGRN